MLIPYDKVSKSDDIIAFVENAGADIVVVDDFTGLGFDSHSSVEKFLYELKNVAGRTNTTVICIYNLDVPKVRIEKRPMLSDFPADCYHRMFDVIQFLFMPEKHYADAYEEKDILEVINVKGHGEIHGHFEWSHRRRSKTIYKMEATPYSSCRVVFVDKFGIRWGIMTEQTEH